jgi:glycine betaine transporter
VGTFIARISRGRTIRSVVLGVVAVPSVFSFVWFAVLGGTAVQRQRSGIADVAQAAEHSKSAATFEILGTLPLAAISSVVIVAVLGLLFITSADSASFTLGSTTSGGTQVPPKPLRLMWSFGAAFAAVLLLEGGTRDLHASAVVSAVPFALILVALCVSLVKGLVTDRQTDLGDHASGRPDREAMSSDRRRG